MLMVGSFFFKSVNVMLKNKYENVLVYHVWIYCKFSPSSCDPGSCSSVHLQNGAGRGHTEAGTCPPMMVKSFLFWNLSHVTVKQFNSILALDSDHVTINSDTQDEDNLIACDKRYHTVWSWLFITVRLITVQYSSISGDRNHGFWPSQTCF